MVYPDRRRLAARLGTWLLYRIDVWAVAFMVSAVALIVHSAITPRSLALASAMALLYWIGYAVNDYLDAQADAGNPEKAHLNVFVSSKTSPRMASLFLAGGLALVLITLATYGIKGWAVFAAAMAVTWAYSARPLRLKTLPVADVLTHGLFVQTFPYFVCVYLSGSPWSTTDYWLLAVNFLCSVSGQIGQQLRDLYRDRNVESNFTVAAGREAATGVLRAVTWSLACLAIGGFGAGGIPLRFAPLAIAFVPRAALRVFRPLAPHPHLLIVLCTLAALAYTSLLISIA